MAESRFVLDTNAVIFLTTRGNIIPASLQNELNNASLFISVITEIELFAKPSLSPDEEKKLSTFLSTWIIITELVSIVKKETIALRRATKLKLPDCIVAATSIVLDAILLTDDKHLLDISWPGLRTQKLVAATKQPTTP